MQKKFPITTICVVFDLICSWTIVENVIAKGGVFYWWTYVKENEGKTNIPQPKCKTFAIQTKIHINKVHILVELPLLTNPQDLIMILKWITKFEKSRKQSKHATIKKKHSINVPPPNMHQNPASTLWLKTLTLNN